MMFSTYLFAVVPFILTAILFCALPYWRHDRMYFGVTVAPEFGSTAVGKRIARGYRWGVAALSMLAIASSVIGIATGNTWLFVAAALFQSFGTMAVFASAHGRVQPHAAPGSMVRSASLAVGAERLPGGWPAMLLPLLLLAGAGIYAQLHWSQIPERFPVHWDVAGRPNGWSGRNWWGVYGLLSIGAMISVAAVAGALGLFFGTRRGGDDESRAWHARFRRATVRLLIAVEWIVCGTFSMLVVAPIVTTETGVSIPSWPIPVLVLLIAGLFTWPLIRLNSEPGSGQDQTPDDCWKWGLIYYNPSDPALMVERRFGIGYTLNLANRMSWVLVAGLVAMTFGIIFLARPA